ncbi:MAG: FHA domain-containing protein [Gammaproteobacteria bacterium]
MTVTLKNIFSKPVQLKVAEHLVTFHSIADFEFSLNGRTSVPVKKITEMVKQAPQKLRKEATTIKEIEKRFVSILSRSIENPKSINQALRELDLNVFSQDHNWRSIMSALNAGDDELNPYRRVALVKYMQYLSARQEIIKYLYSEKQSAANAVTPTMENNGASTAADRLSGTLILESPIVESLRETATDGLERLPKGEAVVIQLGNNRAIGIRLSKHKCSLSSRNGTEFIDQSGKHYPLNMGRNIIGRDPASTIKLDSSLRDISRLHLLIENLGNNRLQLTDMSSHGTFMNPSLFAQQQAV